MPFFQEKTKEKIDKKNDMIKTVTWSNTILVSISVKEWFARTKELKRRISTVTKAIKEDAAKMREASKLVEIRLCER